jgi:hypothetical protein
LSTEGVSVWRSNQSKKSSAAPVAQNSLGADIIMDNDRQSA